MDLRIELKTTELIQATRFYSRAHQLNTTLEAQNVLLNAPQAKGYTKISSECVSRSIDSLENLLSFVVEHFELDDVLNILEEQIDAEIKLVKKE